MTSARTATLAAVLAVGTFSACGQQGRSAVSIRASAPTAALSPVPVETPTTVPAVAAVELTPPPTDPPQAPAAEAPEAPAIPPVPAGTAIPVPAATPATVWGRDADGFCFSSSPADLLGPVDPSCPTSDRLPAVIYLFAPPDACFHTGGWEAYQLGFTHDAPECSPDTPDGARRRAGGPAMRPTP